jgi:predicted RNA-binding Zn-ribbon protein involved in translation (DUF1610 family)
LEISQVTTGIELVRWAARVAPGKVRRLYESYARGIVDDDLLDDVALGFYARCESILAIKRAKEGRVQCPVCDQVILRDRSRKNDRIRCEACGWETTWFDYSKTFRRRQLHYGGAADVFEEYTRRLPSARTAHEKMRVIDWLLHECHKMQDLSTGERFPARPIAPNLIRANMTECIALLDELAYGPAEREGTKAAQTEWRARLSAGRRRMMEQVRGRQRES